MVPIRKIFRAKNHLELALHLALQISQGGRFTRISVGFIGLHALMAIAGSGPPINGRAMPYIRYAVFLWCVFENSGPGACHG